MSIRLTLVNTVAKASAVEDRRRRRSSSEKRTGGLCQEAAEEEVFGNEAAHLWRFSLPG